MKKKEKTNKILDLISPRTKKKEVDDNDSYSDEDFEDGDEESPVKTSRTENTEADSILTTSVTPKTKEAHQIVSLCHLPKQNNNKINIDVQRLQLPGIVAVHLYLVYDVVQCTAVVMQNESKPGRKGREKDPRHHRRQIATK